MLTRGALTIAIGRLVDDSIVVIENIKRHLGELQSGADRAAAIVAAVREVAGAITASVSYTHLDVYKRQGSHGASAHSALSVGNVSGA